jgi:hypothetical protein
LDCRVEEREVMPSFKGEFKVFEIDLNWRMTALEDEGLRQFVGLPSESPVLSSDFI